MIWIHETLAAGSTVTRYVDAKAIVLNRTGGPGLLAALNFDTWNARTITCETIFGPGVQPHDYTGRHPDIRTDHAGRATFRLPSDAFQDGQSYLCFSRAGFGQPVSRIGRATTQTFFGAADLNTAPATPGALVTVGRIWCAGRSPLSASFSLQPRDGMRETDVSFVVVAPSGRTLVEGGKTARATVAETGWHLLRVAASLSARGSAEFRLSVTYWGTEGL